MMCGDELSTLLARYEGRRVDFKEEVSVSLYRLLSAFANTAGGVAIIGVRDSDHAVVGLDLRNNAGELPRSSRAGLPASSIILASQ